ncbi:hypothetical protein [Variovorax sp. UMC13]|uniref:hypothetical protein n=1 Tax=Variovorax sp. UMC13 TaxID=1862326 RepID=UPI0015FFF554|nr:hypothetical protein [Variovorax sp. UMC13]MBB1599489.1 hypothetical protein [Variovorax sp. UMC13]
MNRFQDKVKGLKIGQSVALQARELGMSDPEFHGFARQLEAGTIDGYIGEYRHVADGLIDQISVRRIS